jgi:hypothetical protein
MALADQTVTVVRHRVHFEDCELCVASLAHALRSHTSTIVGSSVGTRVHEHVDSKEMARWLRHFEDRCVTTRTTPGWASRVHLLTLLRGGGCCCCCCCCIS